MYAQRHNLLLWPIVEMLRPSVATVKELHTTPSNLSTLSTFAEELPVDIWFWPSTGNAGAR